MAKYRQLKHPCYVTLGYNHLTFYPVLLAPHAYSTISPNNDFNLFVSALLRAG